MCISIVRRNPPLFALAPGQGAKGGSRIASALKSGPPRPARRLVDQRRAQLPGGLPQRQRARQPQQRHWLPPRPELECRAAVVDARPRVLDPMTHPVRVAQAFGLNRPPNCKAPGVLVGVGVDAPRRTLPGQPLAAISASEACLG